MTDAERADWLEREIRWLRDELLGLHEQPSTSDTGRGAKWAFGESADKLSDLLAAYGTKAPA